MRILIVDDFQSKYDRFIAGLELVGISRADIMLVTNANDARDCLENTAYDLMVLDVVLPLRAGDAPRDQNSIDLLIELASSDSLLRPRQIVGITAHDELVSKVAPIFKERLWTVVSYKEGQDEWIKQLLNCAVYLLGGADRGLARKPGVDLAIVCALHTPELAAVLQLPWDFKPARPIDDHTFVHDGKFLSDNSAYSVVAVAAPRMGMVSTALTAAKVIEILRPRCIVMIGICAGVKGKANVGDVILIDPCWDWQSGKRVRDKDDNATFSVAPHQLDVPSMVRSHVEQLRADSEALNGISNKWKGDLPGKLRVVIGPVASGSAVLADGQVISEIREHNRELCGIEMEAYGLYAAARIAPNPQPIAFALKAVCDFADSDKDDKHQSYAAFTSANVAALLFERYAGRLLP